MYLPISIYVDVFPLLLHWVNGKRQTKRLKKGVYFSVVGNL